MLNCMFHFVGEGPALSSTHCGFTLASSQSLGLPATLSPDSDPIEMKKNLPGIDHEMN